MNNRKNINRDTLLLGQPKDILRTIFSFFNQRDLGRAGATCKQLNELSKEEQFKSLPMPELDYTARLIEKALHPDQETSSIAAFFKLMGHDAESIHNSKFGKHSYINHILPFAEGAVFFSSRLISYEYWDKNKNQFQSMKLGSGMPYNVSSACVLNENTFIVGDYQGVYYHYYRIPGTQDFACNQFRLTDHKQSVAALLKLDQVTFASAYADEIVIFKINGGDEYVYDKKYKVQFEKAAVITCMAGTLDNLFIGFSSGDLARCYTDEENDVVKSTVITRFDYRDMKNITCISPDIIGIFYSDNRRLFLRYEESEDGNKPIPALIKHENLMKNIQYVVPLTNATWITSDTFGKLNSLRVPYKKELKLAHMTENDNTVSTPKLK